MTMTQRIIILLAIANVLFSSCMKDRLFPPLPDDNIKPVIEGSLLVNEVVSSGASDANEFGTMADWFEIYNPSQTDTIFLKLGQWEFRDASNTWLLTSDTFVAPNSFLIVFCDGQNTVLSEIHTNFNLSSNGDEIHLYYIPQLGTAFEVDGYVFGVLSAGTSKGRSPDGSSTWVNFSNPTLGSSNP